MNVAQLSIVQDFLTRMNTIYHISFINTLFLTLPSPHPNHIFSKYCNSSTNEKPHFTLQLGFSSCNFSTLTIYFILHKAESSFLYELFLCKKLTLHLHSG